MAAAATLSDFSRRTTLSDARAGRRDALVAGTIFFIVSLALAISWGSDLADDSWLLQVTARFVHGDVLYRDTYLPVTPLSIYLLALPTWFVGVEMLTLKIETALAFAAVVLISLRINHQLGAGKRSSVPLIVALFALASPGRMVLLPYYSHVATLSLLATFTSWLSWRESRDIRWMYLCGALLGACFVTKQNTGVYGVAALVISEIVRGVFDRESASRSVRNLGRAAAGFVVVVVIVLVPVALTGGWHDMIAEGFIGRAAYLTYAGFPYTKQIRDLRAVAINPGLASLRYINASLPYFLPFIAGPLLLILLVRDEDRERGIHVGVTAFTAAAFAAVYPRPDQPHMIFAVPMLLIAIAYCWRHLSPSFGLRTRRIVRYAAFGLTAATLAFMCASAIRRVLPGEGELSSIPHFRGLVYPRYLHVPLKGNIEHLGAFDGKRMFYLGPHASFYYVAGELRNPTRYDYPSIISIGASGTREIISKIMDGHIERVCLGPGDAPPLDVPELKEWIRNNMTRLPQPEFCEQYARRTEGQR